MSIHDRPYMQEDGGSQWTFGGGGGGMRLGLPKPARAVKILLLINIAVYVLQVIADQATRGPTGLPQAGVMSRYLGVTAAGWYQLWRYLTFQFLHDPNYIWHIILNMLGLYFLGSPLERAWGTRRFVTFYLACGAAAGVAYAFIAAATTVGDYVPLIGASGGVYGIILAAAVLFPGFRIIFLFFPVPIRLAAVIIFGVVILNILGGIRGGFERAMSDVAHFGGAACAAVWIWILPQIRGQLAAAESTRKQNAWRRKVEDRQHREQEVDRILDKIKREGIGSLSAKEKKTLQDATRQQRDNERYIDTGR